MATFGFSVGDFLAAGKLIAEVISALKEAGGSRQQYQRLIQELQILQLALEEVGKLDGPEELRPTSQAIKDTTLSGLLPLQEFLKLAESYKSSLVVGQSNRPFRNSGRKIMWVAKKEDIRKLRGEMNNHVGAINMLLGLCRLKCSSIAATAAAENRRSVLESIDTNSFVVLGKIDEGAVAIREDIRSCKEEVKGQSKWQFGQLFTKVAFLVESMTTLSATTLATFEIFHKLQTSIPTPDIRHSWFQEPILFEDALSRKWPIPSEYDLDTVKALLVHKFKQRSDSGLAQSGNYVLQDIDGSDKIIGRKTWKGFLPGQRIVMAILSIDMAWDGHDWQGCSKCSFYNRIDTDARKVRW